MRYLVTFLLLLVLAACQRPQRELTEDEVPQSERYTYVSTDGNTTKKVYYDVKEGFAVTEGDILLGTVEEANAVRIQTEKGNEEISSIAIVWKNAYWKKNTIPYVIEEGFEDTRNIKNAIKHLVSNTNLKMVERTDEIDYISFHPVTQGCFAHVGRKGGKQLVNLESRCSAKNTAHEILHAAGFWHEQSRHDRDDFIKINWENISEEEKHNFNQELSNGIDVGEYDYQSIMHYGAFAFSKNGKATITKLDGSTDGFGSPQGLSSKDVVAINRLYP